LGVGASANVTERLALNSEIGSARGLTPNSKGAGEASGHQSWHRGAVRDMFPSQSRLGGY